MLKQANAADEMEAGKLVQAKPKLTWATRIFRKHHFTRPTRRLRALRRPSRPLTRERTKETAHSGKMEAGKMEAERKLKLMSLTLSPSLYRHRRLGNQRLG